MSTARWFAISALSLLACSDPGAGDGATPTWGAGVDDTAAGGAAPVTGFGNGYGGGTVVGGGDQDGAGGDATSLPDVTAPEDTATVADTAPIDTWLPPPDDTTQPPPVDTATPPPDTAPPEEDTGGNGTVLPTCGEDEVAVEKPKAPATVLIVMDRSGSMEGAKWEQAKAAVGKVLDAHGPYINFGLLVFPAKKSSSCVLPGVADVPFALNNGPTIVDTMGATGTGGDTPTGGALQAASQIFLQAKPAGDRVVVVATDGEPNCAIDCGKCGCALGCDFLCFNEDTCAEDEVFAAVSALAAQDVKTYVIGIEGSGGAKKVLNKMAELGGTALPGDPAYFEANNGDDLAAALDTIAGSVGSCSANLQIPPGTAFVVVEINGEKLLKDPTHTDGWDLLEGDVMQLYGSACESASAEGSTVEVTYVCKYKQ